MSAVTFIPSSDSDKGIWFGNFQTKLGTYAATVGITAAEVTQVQKDYAVYSYILNMLEIYKQMTNTFTSYKNMLKHPVGQQHLGPIPALPTLPAAPPAVAEGIFDRVSKLVKRIKKFVILTIPKHWITGFLHQNILDTPIGILSSRNKDT